MTSSGKAGSAGGGPSLAWDRSHVQQQQPPPDQDARGAVMVVPRGSPPALPATTSASSGTGSRLANGSLPPSAQRRPAGSRPRHPELRVSFDPLRDLHTWTMWRTAVNGRIVDETQRRRGRPGEGEPNPFGHALVNPPLGRFVRVGDGSQSIAGAMMDPEGKGEGPHLQTGQFVYYGVPRVVLKKPAPYRVNPHQPQ